MSLSDVSPGEMSSSFDPDDLARLGGIFAEDLRSAFPQVELPEPVVEDHLAAMMQAAQLLADTGASVPEPASHPSPEGLTTPRRTRMRTRLTKRLVAVGAALSLTLGGLAVASALEGGGSDDPGDDGTTAVVAPVADDVPTLTADDQGEDSDEQGDATDDQGDDKQSDDPGDQGDEQGAVAPDQGDEQSDDQGEDGDDQGQDEQGDGQSDDQGDQADEQGDQGDSQDGGSADDASDGGDSQQ